MMCGIVGYIGKRDCLPVLMEGLKRLEYRGYDSAGVALIQDGKLIIRRAVGKLERLAREVRGLSSGAHLGIGHTRWATHGKVSEMNAHPHRAGPIALVHNGIVENYLELKERLISEGARFQSETDTEVIAHLIQRYASQGVGLAQAVQEALKEIRGYYALAIISEEEPRTLIGVRCGPPLVVGMGEGEIFCASDLLAILPYTSRMAFLDDGEMVIVSDGVLKFLDLSGKEIDKDFHDIPLNPALAEKGIYTHFMQKEIFEQPLAITNTLRGRIDVERGEVILPEVRLGRRRACSLKKIFLVACGTSFHAALMGKFIFEKLLKIGVEVDIASEFRYRDPVIGGEDLLVLISQSGETADTLAAGREGKAKGAQLLAIVNVPKSSLARMADHTLYTHAGMEVGVASTKTFVAQMTALYLLALYLGEMRGGLTHEQVRGHLKELLSLPSLVERVLSLDGELSSLARRYHNFRNFLYLGRGINYPIALEGALKLKEISYIHAEGYPAGEMKHGPIALIDKEMPVVALAPKNSAYEKVLSNIEEVKARDGIVIALATEGDEALARRVDHILYIPPAGEFITPILLTVPLQLFAYHVARIKGTDVDQPRNLAKSVTVE